MSEDIEHLKTNKIATPAERERLVQLGERKSELPAEEALGGSGKRPEGPVDKPLLRERIDCILKTIYDPEIPVSIYELGLIYDIAIDDDANVEIEMTLTAPACPVAGQLVQEVAQKTGEAEGVNTSRVKLVWDPPWTQDRMSEVARLELGFF